jgi:hypothetical protein
MVLVIWKVATPDENSALGLARQGALKIWGGKRESKTPQTLNTITRRASGRSKNAVRQCRNRKESVNSQ